ncbi:polysaccharide pyruvyl transferase family protein [uncultured Microbulbifer sp.]|uniref:polysaccharide pyruvyl transferase family protein n=1 Tax=uncultured Microbulbifer sp. TaxID=348147 RepID=UPI00260D0BDD|nr:polysaccharide pyruvyl transferase family protein [uncultured Microbulbifer sp.]
MKKVLMRAGKNPFTTIGYEDVLQKNILGTNSGNLIFAHAAHKTMRTDKVHITHAGYTANLLKADEINEKYDYFVLPFANAFRKSFEGNLKNYTKLIKKLKIPVIVVGVGAQTDLNYNMESMSSIDESVKEFVRVVLDRSTSIGVRGELTAAYLNKLGFKDVDVIGCPSLFLHGQDFKTRIQP